MPNSKSFLPIIFLDMDGVMADFHSAIFHMYGLSLDQYKAAIPYKYAIHEWVSKVTGKELTEERMWLDINKATDDNEFWLHIAPYPWWMSLYDLCCSHSRKVIISSSPGHHHGAYSQKIKWIKRWLPCHPMKDVMLGHAKWTMAKRDRILIDDCDANIENFTFHSGRGILFPRLWNKKATAALTMVTDDQILMYMRDRISNVCDNVVMHANSANK